MSQTVSHHNQDQPSFTGQKYFIKTYGCQMNSYDSEKMAALLQGSLGMEATENIDEACLLVMNTCSIREKAQEKVFSELGRWKKHKHKRQLTIAVTGCVASQEAENLIKRAPSVNIVLGPQTIHRLPALFINHVTSGKPQVDVTFPEIEKFDHLPEKKDQSITAHLSIMEGCNKFCSYCIVPYTRGQEISRHYESVIQEAQSLATVGVKEIILLGQNVNDYDGLFTGTEDRANLALLIESISQIQGIERIRFTTSHPQAFDDTLISAYGNPHNKLCNHLHLPVQSGSDRILKLMKRDYTANDYLEIISGLQSVCPSITISTDIIVGFPNESDLDFQQTLDLVDQVGFDHSYSFIYSARPGTPASVLDDSIPLHEKKARLAVLQQKLMASAHAIAQKKLHQSIPVLIEGPCQYKPGFLTGRTENNRVVTFQGPLTVIGQCLLVQITEILPNSLRGRLSTTEVATPSSAPIH